MTPLTRAARVVAVAAIAVAILAGVPPDRAGADPTPKPAPCSAPQYRDFDFWVGDWDVFDGADKVAHVRVESILDGCVIHEIYADTAGAKGESFSIYDAPRQVWHQTWVTNHGTLLTIEGTFRDGAMTMSGTQVIAGGAHKEVRGVWRAVAGGVRETAVTSLDGGATWKPWFDLMFRPRT